MKKLMFLVLLLYPFVAFGQSNAGNYRAMFINFLSEPRVIVAEFEVKSDNSLAGRLKIGEDVRTFSGSVDKKGKFEAIIDQNGGETFKIRGRFDKENKISLVRRSQSGGGLNKSVSETSLEGTFSRFTKPIETPVATSPKVDLIDTGKSWLKTRHQNPLFGEDWSDFTAVVNFGSNAKDTMNMGDPPDYFNLSVKSTDELERTFRVNVLVYTPDKKIWKMNELKTAFYREVRGNDRMSFAAGSGLQTDSFHDGGTLEIVRETETQLVFKLTNFRIKQFLKDGSVELNGFIYAEKYKP